MGVQRGGDREPAIPENENASSQERKPLEAEIVEEGTSYQSSRTGGGAYGGQRRREYVNRTITFAPVDTTGCLAALITLTLFFACLFQWGLLAAIGFIVFHTIGSVISSIHTARQLVRGLSYNIWNLRICNWVISFFITAWLSGGFE